MGITQATWVLRNQLRLEMKSHPFVKSPVLGLKEMYMYMLGVSTRLCASVFYVNLAALRLELQ